MSAHIGSILVLIDFLRLRLGMLAGGVLLGSNGNLLLIGSST